MPSAEIAKTQAWLASRPSRMTCAWPSRAAPKQQNESGAFLIEAAFLALFLIAIVLLALFNSFYHAAP